MAGYIVYEGPSRLDGKPIVCIVTGVGNKSEWSKNEKTGPLAQVWILRSDVSPIQAVNDGEDESICGKCILRGVIRKNPDGSSSNKMRSCYVDIKNAPRAVYQAYVDGKYPPLTDDVRWKNQATRLCAYGDSSAIPYSISKDLISRGNGKWTGYTHSKSSHANPLKKLLMASVHSKDEAEKMHKKGWRTFRTMSPGDSLMPNEIMCPASKEEGKRLTCETCLACSGTGPKNRRKDAVSIAIYAHGSPSKMGSYKRTFEV
tara:strand:- start:30223 stop:30999 length:777 start_codon:yes stop_codon:yes gene_type:complete